MPRIQLIVGLGNPGTHYEATRHNAGAWFVEALAKQHHSVLKAEKRFRSLYSQFTLADQKIILLFPQTFMNLSGEAVALAARYFQIPAANILVAHDELDLPTGQAKLKFGGGHAGHNGLKDIIAQLVTKDFWRLRIGIDHPRHHHPQQDVVDYVLGKPSPQESSGIHAAIDLSLQVSDWLYQGAFNKAIQQLHTTA